jgi:phosphoglycolate phosphatase
VVAVLDEEDHGKIMKVKAVIFDLDGTLLNTLSDIGEASNKILSFWGLPTPEIEEYKSFIGNGTKNMIRKASRDALFEHEIDNAVEMFVTEYSKGLLAKTFIYNGIIDLLNELDRQNILYAVLSNKPHLLTVELVRHYFPNMQFSCIMGQCNNYPIKPDASQAKLIISDFGCFAEQVAIVGDSVVDIDTAKNVGTFSLGVLWGYGSKDQLLRHGADVLAESPNEVINILQSKLLS